MVYFNPLSPLIVLRHLYMLAFNLCVILILRPLTQPSTFSPPLPFLGHSHPMDMPGRGLYDERDSGIARSGRLIRLRSKAQIDLHRYSFRSYASYTQLLFWVYLRPKTPWEFTFLFKTVTFFPKKHVFLWFWWGKKHQMICLNLKVQGQTSELLNKSWLL